MSLCLLHEEALGAEHYWPVKTTAKKPPTPQKIPKVEIPALGAIYWVWLGDGERCAFGPKVGPITVLPEGSSHWRWCSS